MAQEESATSGLVGPRSDKRPPRQQKPEEVRLDDEAPLYHVFLMGNDLVTGEEVRRAKNKLRTLAEKNPDAVLFCQGKTRAEALQILDSIERGTGTGEMAA